MCRGQCAAFPPARRARGSRAATTPAAWDSSFPSTLRRLPHLPPIGRGEARLAELVSVEHETDQRAARLGVGVDLVDLERVYGEDVAMRLVALGRARSTVAGFAEVGPRLHRTLRRLTARRVANAQRKRGHAGRYVEHDPVPPAAPGRRIGVVDRDREALGARGRVLPQQGRRDIAALAAEALEHLRLGDLRAGLDLDALQGEGSW